MVPETGRGEIWAPKPWALRVPPLSGVESLTPVNHPASWAYGGDRASMAALSSSTFSPLLCCSSVLCVIKMWLAWDGFRSGLWPPLATHKAIWSTCWMGSPTRVPPASSQETCSSSLAVVSSPKRRERNRSKGERPGQGPKDGHSAIRIIKALVSAQMLPRQLLRFGVYSYLRCPIIF